ncbi:Demethylmenaquinone methyltransferase [Madurella mycetomatis]|uniref:Demethylmenaquinone methyltransferase n=1 Tax=Madurella mycetomatis TaxID=100816 RepID=A0A175W707_9PEZI|nr:Demethylmenaquinone methyltransferase [Madurella mycetomatis]
MSFRSESRPLDDFEFTFESYLDDSARIEPDPNPHGYVYDTQSLSESIAKYQEEFGRTYHSYRAGSYHFPNDAPENTRMEEQYEIMKMVMDGRLHLAPFSRQHPPRKILDIATGTGIWAVEMGDEYPEAQIIGTDLSPIQPAFVPPNVRFFVEDSTEDWDYPADFDFIHTRVTIGCWSDMKRQIIQQAFDHLQPGGWLECQEVPALPFCDDGTMTDDFGWLRWAREFVAVSQLANRQDIGVQLKDWMCEVGFVDVHEAVFKIPLNSWPKDGRLKYVGMLWQRNLLEGLSAFSLGLFNRFLGKSVEEIEISLVDVRRSVFDHNVHAYHKLYVVYGRKPESS